MCQAHSEAIASKCSHRSGRVAAEPLIWPYGDSRSLVKAARDTDRRAEAAAAGGDEYHHHDGGK